MADPQGVAPRAQGGGGIAVMGGAIAAAVIAIDQLVKAWALHIYELPVRGHVELSPVMDLTMVWNRGVSFGLLYADNDIGRWLLAGFSVVVAGLLAWWLSKAQRRLLGVALGLVIGGALGNAIDRIVHGAVADFLDFSDIWFPWVFNIADASISVGVGLMLLDAALAPREPKKSAKTS